MATHPTQITPPPLHPPPRAAGQLLQVFQQRLSAEQLLQVFLQQQPAGQLPRVFPQQLLAGQLLQEVPQRLPARLLLEVQLYRLPAVKQHLLWQTDYLQVHMIYHTFKSLKIERNI